MTAAIKKAAGLLALLLLVGLCFAGVTLINLTSQVTGVLPAANGGTGQNSSATFPASGTVMTTATSVACSQMPALTGNVTTSAGACSTTIAGGVVTNAMLASAAYVKAVFDAGCTGTVTSSSTSFFGTGWGGSTTACTGNTTVAGGKRMTSSGTIKNLQVNLSAAGKSGDKVNLLKNASTTGAPTCTYSTGTSCSDTSSALAVVAGDVITIQYVSGASDGSANLSVSFELWN